MGGAPEASGKVSKLAALAARKRKDGERKAAAEAISDSTAAGSEASPPPSNDQRSAPISLLDRLAVGGGRAQGTAAPARPVRLPLRSGKGSLNRSPGQPLSPGPGHAATPESAMLSDTEPQPPQNGKRKATAAVSAETIEEEEEKEERPSKLPDLRAEPSAFAMVLVGARGVGGDDHDDVPMPNPISHNIDVMQFFGQDLTEAFDFAEPSPDDIVIKARESAKGLSGGRTANALLK